MARPKGDPIRVNVYVSAGAIKIGDFVNLNSDGQVKVAAASEALLGVCNTLAAAAGQEVAVFDHPEQMYLVVKSGTQPAAQTDFNLNYDIVAGTSSSVESAHTLNSSSGATTAALPLRAVDRSRVLGSTLEAVVRINNHTSRAGVAGV